MSDAVALPSHHPNIRVECNEHVATVALDRTESKNACTGAMWVALGASFRALSYSGIRAIVLTGANGEFCTGAGLTYCSDRARFSAIFAKRGLSLDIGTSWLLRLAQSVDAQTSDMREALMAFVERRPPNVEGR